MKRATLVPVVGFTLVGVLFAFSAAKVLRHSSSAGGNSAPVVRLGHWQLEPPVRAAFEKVAEEYMRRKPGARVEVLAVPERIYPTWFMTQLVGGFAPDIVQLGRSDDPAFLSRYIRPITPELAEANPYNAKNALVATPWRDTFIDGLANNSAYNSQLLEYVGVPVSLFTFRVIYNRTLWKELLGDAPVPRNYAELKELGLRASETARALGRDVTPLAASRVHMNSVFNALVASQTQGLVERLRGTPLYHMEIADYAAAFAAGEWSFQSPELASGLDLVRDSSALFPPGAQQLAREDAVFYFLQGRTLMVPTGNWDYSSYRSQANFELGVFEFPLPEAGGPGFGRFVRGRPTEGGAGTNGVFGLTRGSRHPQEALDFLHFLTSAEGNRIFVEASGWLPAVVGVEPRADVAAFAPREEGVPDGVGLSAGTAWGPEARRVVESGMHLVLGPNGNARIFSDYLKANIGPAVLSDWDRQGAQQNRVVQRQDVMLMAWTWLDGANANPEWRRKQSETAETQTLIEQTLLWSDLRRNATAP